jgi:hypothetical protein
VTGIACPEPNCRLPISEDMLKRIFGAESADAWQKRMVERTKKMDAMRKGLAVGYLSIFFGENLKMTWKKVGSPFQYESDLKSV